MTTAAPPSPSRQLLPARPEDITALQDVTSYPCVTVLCTTSVGDRLRPEDASRLQHLVREAERRLCSELAVDYASAVIDRLEHLLRDAAARPTGRGIALFVGGEITALHHLPLEVVDRVVVDPTFATRDLVRGLQRRPPYLLLILGSTTARLLAVEPNGLRKVAQYDTAGESAQGRRPAKLEVARSRDEQRRRFLRLVDKNLGLELQRRPRPVVVAGVDRLTAEFTALTRNTNTVAGAVRGAHSGTAPSALRALADSVLDAHLDGTESAVIERVDRARRAGRVAMGLDAAWLAAHHNRPDMLAVEEGLAVPARVGAEHDLLRAEDHHHPDVLDDAVDELVEAVIAAGGWVAFLRDGSLARYGGAVLTLRT